MMICLIVLDQCGINKYVSAKHDVSDTLCNTSTWALGQSDMRQNCRLQCYQFYRSMHLGLMHQCHSQHLEAEFELSGLRTFCKRPVMLHVLVVLLLKSWCRKVVTLS